MTKILIFKSAKGRVNERYNKHESFNLTRGERKKSIVVNKNKFWKKQNLDLWLYKMHDATTMINGKVSK